MPTSRTILVAMAFVTTPFLVRSFLQSPQVSPLRPPFLQSRSICKMSSDAPATNIIASKIPKGKDPKTMTEKEWRSVLSAKEYQVLRGKATEYPGTGVYDGYYPDEGYFACAACGNPIYSAESKFQSGCGWPAFDKCYEDSIAVKKDSSFGMSRVEVMCAKCEGHLGHVFQGERLTDTNERHCVNSVSIKYVKAKAQKEEVKIL